MVSDVKLILPDLYSYANSVLTTELNSSAYFLICRTNFSSQNTQVGEGERNIPEISYIATGECRIF